MVVEKVYAIDATVNIGRGNAGTTETMADRSPPDRLNIASFKQRNSAITEDLERQEVERENLWKRLQAARAEGDQLRALGSGPPDE